MESAIKVAGESLKINGSRVLLPPWKSFHKVPGLSVAWCPVAVIDGHFVNADPDDFPQVDNGGSGGRAGVYQDIGTNNYTITYTQEFYAQSDVYVQSAPLVCIDLDDPRFGLAIWYESEFFGGTWVIWEIGRLPEDIALHVNPETGQELVINDQGLVEEGVYRQMELKMVVSSGRIRAYGDGELRFDFPIPSGLVDSTLVGMSIDIGGFAFRPPNIAAGIAPYILETAPNWPENSDPLPRVSVSGKYFLRHSERFRLYGYQPMNHDIDTAYYQSGGESERLDQATQLIGNKSIGANCVRLHLQLFDFVEGPDKDTLSMRTTALDNLIYLLDIARNNAVYVLLSGNNVWRPETAPTWYDTLTYQQRWDVQSFFLSGVAAAIYGAGHSTTIIGYELVNEPMISTDPAIDWYQGNFLDSGYYFVPVIARGPEVNNTTVRNWITQLKASILSGDPDALVTCGVIGDFWPGPFGYANTQDLFDFLSPHIYPPLGAEVSTGSEVTAVNAWDSATLPLLIGETAAWNFDNAVNTALFDAMRVVAEGLISFSYGYGVDGFTTPPRFPAAPDIDPATYIIQRDAIGFAIAYRDTFMTAP